LIANTPFNRSKSPKNSPTMVKAGLQSVNNFKFGVHVTVRHPLFDIQHISITVFPAFFAGQKVLTPVVVMV